MTLAKHARSSIIAVLIFFWPSISTAQLPPGNHWTELHWLEWWSFVEDSHRPGENDEETYWRIRIAAEHFGVMIPELGVEFDPPPDFGEGPIIGDLDMKSASKPDKPPHTPAKAMICIGYPDGINPCRYHSSDPPPQAVVTAMTFTASGLLLSGNPYTVVVGGAMFFSAGFFQIWIDLEEENEEEDE